MIERQFTDLTSLQIDIKQYALLKNNYNIYSSDIPNQLKLAWVISNEDIIWTIKIKDIINSYNKKKFWFKCY